MRPVLILAAFVAALALAPEAASAEVLAAGSLRLAPVGNFDQPTYVTGAPGDPSRVMVVEQGGAIRLLRDGILQPQPFLTVPNVHNGGEQGLLSIAFAPDYASSGRFYAYYSDANACDSSGDNCDIRIDEFRSSGGGADVANPATQRRVIQINHRAYNNHNGGQLQFGPDGYLYAGTGDGGGGGDSLQSGQNLNTLLGKLLRIDPRQAGASAYANPSSNPYFGPRPGLDEIWAYGLRNPWRFSFDALTGDLVIADVGQNQHEEIDVQARAFGGGANYGWNLYEGFARYSNPTGPQPSDYVPPVFAYDHVNGACSITGGYVDRDNALPELAGRYLYGDLCAGVLRSIVVTPPGRALNDAPVGDPANAASPPLQVSQLDSFGQDAACRLYAVSHNGPVYRLLSAAPPAGAGGCAVAAGAPGDRVRPVISRLRMSRSSFAVSKRSTAVGAARRPPHGSAFRFTLSERSTVALRIERRTTGRKVGKRCVAATPRLRRRRACVRWVRIGTLTRRLAGGRRTVAFSGRIGKRALTPGSYRAVVTAVDASGNVSRARTVGFRIVRG
jgi:glucose/arabinose dehydrogenase